LEIFSAFANERGVTPSQLAIAWVLARGRDIVPLIGTRSRRSPRRCGWGAHMPMLGR